MEGDECGAAIPKRAGCLTQLRCSPPADTTQRRDKKPSRATHREPPNELQPYAAPFAPRVPQHNGAGWPLVAGLLHGRSIGSTRETTRPRSRSVSPGGLSWPCHPSCRRRRGCSGALEVAKPQMDAAACFDGAEPAHGHLLLWLVRRRDDAQNRQGKRWAASIVTTPVRLRVTWARPAAPA